MPIQAEEEATMCSDDEEEQALINNHSPTNPVRSINVGVDEDSVVVVRRRRKGLLLGILCLFMLLVLLVFNIGERHFSFSKEGRLTIGLTCPAVVHEPADYDDKHFKARYENVSLAIKQNPRVFLNTFRNTTFDAWGLTYNEIKQRMYKWKSSRYPTFLQNGDSIFESACGIGLNLLMTLEILQENGIHNITVYGNDYVKPSVELANIIWDQLAPTVAGHKGSICVADSTHLDYIPDSSFDLVFTGYLNPLLDPLGFGLSLEENTGLNREVCRSKKDDWKGQRLIGIMQERQNDWYGKWVKEMIRIAKPGKAVIIDGASRPFCEVPADRGGVSESFWSEAIDKYDWDVDPKSIEIEKNGILSLRYDVFMRRNGASGD